MNEVIHLLAGYRSHDDSLTIKKFNGTSGTLEDWIVKVDKICARCESQLAAGDAIWIDV